MTDRNAPCPCGSGTKFKKCHGAGATAAAPAPAESPKRAEPTRVDTAAPEDSAPKGGDDRPFLVMTGRGVESEKAETERKKHLRRRIQSSDLRGTLVYNSGAFYRAPNPQDPES